VLARLNHTPIVYAFASRSKGATPPIEPRGDHLKHKTSLPHLWLHVRRPGALLAV
jgi:hypothetical protein